MPGEVFSYFRLSLDSLINHMAKDNTKILSYRIGIIISSSMTSTSWSIIPLRFQRVPILPKLRRCGLFGVTSEQRGGNQHEIGRLLRAHRPFKIYCVSLFECKSIYSRQQQIKHIRACENNHIQLLWIVDQLIKWRDAGSA